MLRPIEKCFFARNRDKLSDYKLIYQSQDAHGPVLVLEGDGLRVLSFGDNDEQSKLDIRTPHIPKHSYVQVMLESLMYKSPRSALVLGLGGGALVHALRHADGAMKISAVELRHEVIEVAKRYFFLPVGKKLQLFEGDAKVFLESAEHKRVDIVYADIYGADGVDEQQMSPAFIAGALRLLKADGMLVLNCWKEHRDNLALQTLLKQEFAEVYASLSSGGNWVIFASRIPGVLREEGLKQARAELSNRLGFTVGRASMSFGPWGG